MNDSKIAVRVAERWHPSRGRTEWRTIEKDLDAVTKLVTKHLRSDELTTIEIWPSDNKADRWRIEIDGGRFSFGPVRAGRPEVENATQAGLISNILEDKWFGYWLREVEGSFPKEQPPRIKWEVS
jgi:hypothetical protein